MLLQPFVRWLFSLQQVTSLTLSLCFALCGQIQGHLCSSLGHSVSPQPCSLLFSCELQGFQHHSLLSHLALWATALA